MSDDPFYITKLQKYRLWYCCYFLAIEFKLTEFLLGILLFLGELSHIHTSFPVSTHSTIKY